jgi:tRNA threonylcarbamoyladenosine biosynthesis protein TsaE
VIAVRTADADATRDLGRALAGVVRPGDLVVLAGDLGAGKTALTQGIGAGLDVPDRITSPTFTIAQEYAGRLTLHHLDVYRLEHLHEAIDLDLGEILEEPAVVVIEWGDVIAPLLPADHLEIRITFGRGDDDRCFELQPLGPSWTARYRALLEAVAPWSDGATGATGEASAC